MWLKFLFLLKLGGLVLLIFVSSNWLHWNSLAHLQQCGGTKTTSICVPFTYNWFSRKKVWVCKYSNVLNIEADNTVDSASNWTHSTIRKFQIFLKSSKTWRDKCFNELGYIKLCLVENEKCPAKTHAKFVLCRKLELAGHRMYRTWVLIINRCRRALASSTSDDRLSHSAVVRKVLFERSAPYLLGIGSATPQCFSLCILIMWSRSSCPGQHPLDKEA